MTDPQKVHQEQLLRQGCIDAAIKLEIANHFSKDFSADGILEAAKKFEKFIIGSE